MEIIENNWDLTALAIRSAVGLAAKLGYNRDNLSATNAIIPIAYFIYKNNFADSIIHSGGREEDRRLIKEWLARTMLKGTFGGTPDSIYPKMRDLICANIGYFPLQEIITYYKGRSKSISFSEDEIESILDLQYGKPKTYCALTLLYPGLNYNFKYHQDHIHPKSLFNKAYLLSIGLNDAQCDEFLMRFNSLPNLQLLQATQNYEKKDKLFNDWLNRNYSSQSDRNNFLIQNHINVDESLAMEDFLSFIERRRKVLKKQLIDLLNVK